MKINGKVVFTVLFILVSGSIQSSQSSPMTPRIPGTSSSGLGQASCKARTESQLKICLSRCTGGVGTVKRCMDSCVNQYRSAVATCK